MVQSKKLSDKDSDKIYKKKWYQREEVCENCGINTLPKKYRTSMIVSISVILVVVFIAIYIIDNNTEYQSNKLNFIYMSLLVIGVIFVNVIISFTFFRNAEKVIRRPYSD